MGVESGRTQQWPGSIRSFAGGMHRTALAEGFLFEDLGVAGGDGRIPGVSGKQGKLLYGKSLFVCEIVGCE